MPLDNLGKSSEVFELPHNSAIGSQWMIEKDSKEEKEANASILNVLSDIGAEEQNKEDPLAVIANNPDGCAISTGSNAEHPGHYTLQVPKDPTPATLEGSPATNPTPVVATSEGSPTVDPTPAVATSERSLVADSVSALATSEGSPALAPTPATSKGSHALAPPPATSEGLPSPAPAPTPDDPLHNLVISVPSNTHEKEVNVKHSFYCH
jgi:hypothetical protein